MRGRYSTMSPLYPCGTQRKLPTCSRRMVPLRCPIWKALAASGALRDAKRFRAHAVLGMTAKMPPTLRKSNPCIKRTSGPSGRACPGSNIVRAATSLTGVSIRIALHANANIACKGFRRRDMRSAFCPRMAPSPKHFHPRRHLLSASAYREEMRNHFESWAEITGTERAASKSKEDWRGVDARLLRVSASATRQCPRSWFRSSKRPRALSSRAWRTTK